jgi:dTMP kinase
MFTIAFEGVDASGKETQTELLKNYLEAEGLKVNLVSFPRYDTPVGKLIKAALKDEVLLSDKAMHMLLDVDKQDFSDTIEGQAIEYDVTIYDRYIMSNKVYCMAKGIPLTWIDHIQSGIVKPDMTFILHLPAEVSYARKHSNYNAEDLDKHEKNIGLLKRVENIYLTLATMATDVNNKDIVYLIDANKTVEEVHEDIVSILNYSVVEHE